MKYNQNNKTYIDTQKYIHGNQGRSQVIIDGGGQLGPYKFVKNFSAKINKTSINFKNFKKF